MSPRQTAGQSVDAESLPAKTWQGLFSFSPKQDFSFLKRSSVTVFWCLVAEGRLDLPAAITIHHPFHRVLTGRLSA